MCKLVARRRAEGDAALQARAHGDHMASPNKPPTTRLS